MSLAAPFHRPKSSGERKAKDAKLQIVEQRPEAETILSREELEEFRRRLVMLSPSGVEDAYRQAYAECCFNGRTVPPAASIQQLVTAWKVLRSFCSKRK